MTKHRTVIALAVLCGICMPSQAEIVVPNPLIKPAQITPIAASAPPGPGGAADMRDQNQGGAPSLPRLPGLSMSQPLGASTGRAYARDGDVGDGAARKGRADGDSLRTSLARYEVVFVSSDQAVLRLVGKTGPQSQQGTSGPGPMPGGSQLATTGATDRGGPPQVTVRDKGFMKYAGEILRVRIDGDTVELYRHREGGKGDDQEEAVFFESLTPSSTVPYVPDPAKLEKYDARYQNSLIPEPPRSNTNSSSGSSSGTSPVSQ
jgi:hypothetical protein